MSSHKESIQLYLKHFRLSAMSLHLEDTVKAAELENWSYQTFLETLCEHEASQRKSRKLHALLRRSQLPEGKTLATLNEEFIPLHIRKLIPSLLEGHFVDRHENILAFGLPGRGKTHFLAALAHELILQHQKSVLFTPTFKLINRLLVAKKNLCLDKELNKLNSFDLILIDDIGYVQHTREEMEIFFTFLAERYEQKSLMISSNITFSQWDKIFGDPMTAMAAVDRLVHHSVILEFDGNSIREMVAKKRQRLNSQEALMD
jgi:DNA replication protein DnaC